MKQRCTIFFFGLFMILSLTPVEATHFMGVDITYECMGPCTYRIYHRSYYDCTGTATPTPVLNNQFSAPPAPNITFNTLGQSCSQPVPLTGTWQFISYLEVTPLCPDALNPPPGQQAVTGCDGTNPAPLINGVAEAVWYRDYDFCNVTCDSIKIEWYNCCRNYVINSGAAGNGIFTGETKVDLTISPCNNSPIFQNKPVPYICAGQVFTFNQGAIDPDGDSLSYELGPCFDNNSATPIGYNPGFSATAPLGPTWNITVNPLTGDITMQPNPIGAQLVGVMCVVVKEWRNGVQIGQVVRDMQITVLDDCNSTNPITGGVQNVVIGADSVPALPVSYNEARVCADVEICFEIPVISTDTSLSYTISWNQGIPGATFVDATNPAIMNSISGDEPVARFCWTPPTNADGAYFFVVTVQDDACPVPGFNQYTIIVYVEDVLANSDAVALYIDCNEIQLTALPQSTIPSIYNQIFPVTDWTGNGNLEYNPNTSLPVFSHLYPEPGLYFYNLAIEDTFGCSTNIQGIADLPGGVTANAGPDVSICSNFTFLLGTPALPGQFYAWAPNQAINDSSLAQPTFSFPNTGLIQDTINYVLYVTDSVCETYDYTTVIVNPTLQTSISPANPVICIGDSTSLMANGNIIFGNTYLWSTGDTTQSIDVAPATSTTYSVVTFNNGCSSDEIFVTVDVTTGPPAQVTGTFKVCDGGSTVLTASGGDSYLWSVGGFAQPAITITNITQDSTFWVIAYDVNGCPGDTTFIVVSPFEEPVADFSAPILCEGQLTSFTDASTVGDGAIIAWDWDFDDGNISSQQNPDHTFMNPGTYNVSLTVTSSNGCQETLTQAITVQAVPQADFTFTNECEGIANTFNDASNISIGNITSYTWDYGDMTPPGSGPNTSHLYNDYGYYNVTLTVTSNQGCSDEYTRTVFVHPNPIADFDIISACEDSLVLASTSSTVAGSLDFIQNHAWNFGDPGSGNNTSSLENPSHVYANPNVYTVTLTVTTQNGCQDVLQVPVTVHPDPVARFRVEDRCENYGTQFIDESTISGSTTIVGWSWDLGEGTTDTDQNTELRYLSTTGAGTYDVQLAIVSSEGCVDTLVKQVVINKQPRTVFFAKAVCIGEETQFLDRTTIDPGEIVGWEWDFGDNAGQASVQEPSYEYQNPGLYLATLVATSDSGCSRPFTGEVTVYELPQFLQLTDDYICFGDQAFLLVSAPSDVTPRWYASLDDVDNGNILHEGYAYTTPPLPFTTTYYVEPISDVGCINEPEPITAHILEDQSLSITSDRNVVDLPIGIVNFDYSATVGITSFTWNFGDGNFSEAENPTHEYQYPGIYEVILNAEDENGCDLTASMTIEVKKLVTLWLPSAFSPNDDGFNDTYFVKWYNVNPERFQIQIFGRWGQLVFESTNPDFEWDGTDTKNEKLPEGVYVYVVRFQDIDGQDVIENRTITLFR